jgi:hypothetical protein
MANGNHTRSLTKARSADAPAPTKPTASMPTKSLGIAC